MADTWFKQFSSITTCRTIKITAHSASIYNDNKCFRCVGVRECQTVAAGRANEIRKALVPDRLLLGYERVGEVHKDLTVREGIEYL